MLISKWMKATITHLRNLRKRTKELTHRLKFCWRLSKALLTDDLDGTPTNRDEQPTTSSPNPTPNTLAQIQGTAQVTYNIVTSPDRSSYLPIILCLHQPLLGPARGNLLSGPWFLERADAELHIEHVTREFNRQVSALGDSIKVPRGFPLHN